MADTEPHAWETGRMNSITYVGLDVRKASKLAARLSSKNCPVSFCYEAGPCG